MCSESRIVVVQLSAATFKGPKGTKNTFHLIFCSTFKTSSKAVEDLNDPNRRNLSKHFETGALTQKFKDRYANQE